ncbi:hypothetical protein PINS_up008293 [Pythium insidiosum]|nr:hypothetical protein PINS_up008293 [Pythium insidiosum]
MDGGPKRSLEPLAAAMAALAECDAIADDVTADTLAALPDDAAANGEADAGAGGAMREDETGAVEEEAAAVTEEEEEEEGGGADDVAALPALAAALFMALVAVVRFVLDERRPERPRWSRVLC